MPNKPAPISFCSYLLGMSIVNKSDPNKVILLSEATGFVYKKGEQQYLVTNLHVVSGRDINTGRLESGTGAFPEILRANVSVYDTSNDTVNKHKNTILTCCLYDDNGNPRWLIHPEHKRSVDIAVIPLFPTSRTNLFAITDIPNVDATISVADDVFVVGYPLALGANENRLFPLWKRASIASEPSVDYFDDGRKTFVIDGTTKSGMSGSPVFFYSNFSQSNNLDGSCCFSMALVRSFCFLGVYSGRLRGRNSNEDSFLGLVWKKELIDEIIEGNIRDDKYE